MNPVHDGWQQITTIMRITNFARLKITPLTPPPLPPKYIMRISTIHHPGGNSSTNPLNLRYYIINAELLAVIQHTAIMKLGLLALRPLFFRRFISHFSLSLCICKTGAG
jgi:hypothetical protein